MFNQLVDWGGSNVAAPVLKCLRNLWRQIKKVKLIDVVLATLIFFLSQEMPPSIVIAVIATTGSRVNVRRRYYKQWHLLLQALWFALAVGIWLLLPRLAIALVAIQLVIALHMLARFYHANRTEWKPGSAILLTIWDMFGEWGDTARGIMIRGVRSYRGAARVAGV